MKSVCLLVPFETLPSDVQLYIEEPSVAIRVTYLQGNPTIDNDLRRAKLQDASAVLILADKLVTNTNKEDSSTFQFYNFDLNQKQFWRFLPSENLARM